MKSLFLSILLILSITLKAQADTIKFVPLPTMPKETLLGNHGPLVDYLKKKTGLPIELTYESDYEKIVDGLIAGKFDIITAGPLTYSEIKKRFPHVKAIAHFREKDGKHKYRCVLVTSFDGPKKVSEINGKIALTQKLSTCGYLSANIILSRANKDINKLGYKHFETHNEVIESVIRKEFQAGSLRKDIAEQYSGFALRILDQSPEWPSFSVVVNTKTLDRTKINLIKRALLELDPEVEKNLIAGKYGFAEAKEEAFAILEKYEKFKPKLR